MPMPRLLLSGAAVALLVPAAAHGATLTTAPCYYSQQSMQITGSGWGPATEYGVTGQGIDVAGTADDAGNFTDTNATAPNISASGFRPQTFTLTGTQDGAEVASTKFKVVNFLVAPKSTNGKPTGKTTWRFSGFTPGKQIFIHVKRGSHVYTQKAGKGDSPCGTHKSRLRRLPAVPASKITYGKYKVYIDNRRAFKKGGLQYSATITIRKVFL
jgi:hypothetical protein